MPRLPARQPPSVPPQSSHTASADDATDAMTEVTTEATDETIGATTAAELREIRVAQKCCYTGDPAGPGLGSWNQIQSMPSRRSVKIWARSVWSLSAAWSRWRVRIVTNWGPVS